MHKTYVLLASCLALPMLVGASLAQELPREGKFSITYTGVNTAPTKPMQVGNGRELIASATIMTAVNDAGGGLLHNMAGRCFLLTFIDRAAKTQQLNGHCTYADRTGDMVFEEVVSPTPTGLGQPAKLLGHWTGGTGKFTGLNGDFELTNSGNIGLDGVFQAAGKKTGSYRLER